MSRRYGHRGRRRPTGPPTSSIVQLGIFVLGLVILLSFRSEISDGAAGCFDSMARVDEEDAAATPPAAGPANPVEAPPPDEGPSLGTPFEVKVIHTNPPAAAVGGEDVVEPASADVTNASDGAEPASLAAPDSTPGEPSPAD